MSVNEAQRESGVRFARRIYPTRTVGFALAFVAIATPFWEQQAPLPAWFALVSFCFVGPHLAWLHATRSADPLRAEMRNLVADCAAAGMWIALMGFNLVPSMMILSLLNMDRMSVGGARFAGTCLAWMIVAGVATALLFGFEFRPESSMLTVIASLPLLVVYPLAVGAVMYRSATRIREQNRRLAELSRIDGLSGALNHVAWESSVLMEFQRARRHTREASLLMLDIDHFKQVNDHHGHAGGDDVIRNISAILRDCVRKPDTVGRCGGDEFGILLPETSSEAAALMAERIRKRIESEALRAQPEIRATVSIGVAAMAAELNDAAAWIERADRALYRAKQLGRNRSVSFGAATPVSVAA